MSRTSWNTTSHRSTRPEAGRYRWDGPGVTPNGPAPGRALLDDKQGADRRDQGAVVCAAESGLSYQCHCKFDLAGERLDLHVRVRIGRSLCLRRLVDPSPDSWLPRLTTRESLPSSSSTSRIEWRSGSCWIHQGGVDGT